MIDLLAMFTAGLMTLHALIIMLAVAGALHKPERALAMYAGNSIPPPAPALVADPTSVLFMAPLQVVIALLMLHTGYSILVHPSVRPEDAPLLLGVFSLMELGYVLIRLRVNVLRGNRALHFKSSDRLVSARACGVSLMFCVVYGMTAVAML